MPVPLDFVVRANTSQYKSQMAQVKAIAMGASQAGGNGMHGGLGLSSGGGTSGMMRESLVILREIGRGNWARVPGSVTLLIQYMGGLSKILKVTHSDLAQHALDLEKEAQAMAKAALAEAVKNGTSQMQMEATKAKLAWQAAETVALEQQALATEAAAGASVEAAGLEVAAGSAKAAAANLAVIAKQREAAAFAEAAAIEGSATTVALGPIGWLAAALVALGVAAYFVLNRMARVATQMENLAEATGHVGDAAERQTKRMHDQAEAARKLAEEIANVHKHQKTLAEVSDEVVESLKRNADAKANLAKEGKQIQLDEIELAEKMHKISAQEATRQRAAVEIQSAQDVQAAKVKALTDEKAERDAALQEAQAVDKQATADYKAKAEQSTAAGPQGAAHTSRLADLTRQAEFLAKYADALSKEEAERGLRNGPGVGNAIGRGTRAAAELARGRSVKVDGQDMPIADSVAIEAQLAKAKMDAAAQSKLRLQVDADKAAIALADQQNNGGKLTAAQIQDINLRKSMALYEQGQHGVTQGFGLSAQQKAGAYAAMPPDFKRLVDAAIRTANNTDPKAPGFNPVGSTPARFGPGSHR